MCKKMIDRSKIIQFVKDADDKVVETRPYLFCLSDFLTREFSNNMKRITASGDISDTYAI